MVGQDGVVWVACCADCRGEAVVENVAVCGAWLAETAQAVPPATAKSVADAVVVCLLRCVLFLITSRSNLVLD